VKKAFASLLLVITAAACSDAPTMPRVQPDATGGATIVTADIIVTNSNDAGPGSFRDAISQANGNASIATIGFAPDANVIQLQSGIVFTGSQDLTINANHATLDASGAGAGVSAFVASGGGDLALIGLTVSNASGQGVEVQVRSVRPGLFASH
jgi:hypothetical protein